tara:strand:- start:9 stop:536 length:528 start_codon:yes stop_codon:yes gene_type:complete
MSCREFLTCSGYLIAVLSLIGGTIAYEVFGIIYLIEDYRISNECKGSNLWEYVLVSMILACTNVSVKTNDEKVDLSACILAIIGVINLSLSTWGGIELWNYSYSCDELFNSNLWKVGLAGFIIQVTTTAICVIVPPILLCYITIREARNINNIESRHRIEEINENNLNLKIDTSV